MSDERQNNPVTGGTDAMADMESRVAARAAEIEAKVAAKQSRDKPVQKLDPHFVLDCLNRNKVGDATLFCALFRGKYVFVQEWEKFLYWAGHYWKEDVLNRLALADSERVCEAYMNAWAESGDKEGSPLHKKLLKRLDSLRSPKGRKDMLECVISIDDAPVISAKQLDCQPYLLATPNGVVDLRTGECHPGKQEQYLTACCPTEWHGLDAPSPDFQRYLLTCMDEDQEMVDFLIRLLGYALVGEKNLGIWVIMYGPRSRNGKDTLMNLMNYILGDGLSVRFDVRMIVEQKFQRDSSQPQVDLMDLREARLAYCSEANGRQRLDQAKVKDFTGGGKISARGIRDNTMTKWKCPAPLKLIHFQ